MSNPFGNLNTDGLEDAEDRLGGFQPLDTDGYDMTIKMFYAGQSDGGAHNVTIIGEAGGQEHRETIYVTNKKGENFFLNKNDQTKKVPLPGFTTIDHICLVATGAPLSDQEFEDKMVNVYDSDAKKEVPKSVPVATALLGKTIHVGMLRILANKSKKDGNKYVDIPDTREFNEIDKVFDPASKRTVVEAQKGQEEADFYEKWIERNQGQVRDKRSIKDGEAGQSGRPTPGGAGGSGAPARKSLFGNDKAAA